MDNNYWRSFAELFDHPELRQIRNKEFTEQELTAPHVDEMSGMNRRQFLALMGASAALAATGCSNYRDEGQVAPFVKKDEKDTAGVPLYYASSIVAQGKSHSVLITTREGRPIKVNGNPENPYQQGKSNVQVQAELMGLYDPDRLNGPRKGNAKTDWKAFDEAFKAALTEAKSSGKKIALVGHSVLSPSLLKLVEQFTAAYPSTQLLSYELFDSNNTRSAVQKVWGQAVVPTYELSKAKTIVALENDFLGSESDVALVREYALSRNVAVDKKLSKFYAIEGEYSATGSNADVRIALNPFAIQDLLLALLFGVSEKNAGKVPTQFIKPITLAQVAKQFNIDLHKLESLEHDLINGSAVVLPGARLSEEVQILAQVLNHAIGADSLISARFGQQPLTALASSVQISEFVSQVNAGQFGVVIHLDANPVFDWSADLKYGEALKKVNSFSFTRIKTETSVTSTWSAAMNHPLESWGDYSDRIGIYSLQQPMINPIFNTRQIEDVLLSAISGTYTANAYLNLIKTTFNTAVYPSTSKIESVENSWVSTLQDGFILTNKNLTLSFNSAVAAQIAPVKISEITVIVKPSFSLGDGRLANVGWLQELPHPVTKITWDNYASVSPATLEKLKVQVYPQPGRHINEYDKVAVTVNGQTVELAAFPQPGMADDVVVIELGLGRTEAGSIGSGVGFNANILKTSQSVGSFFTGASVKNTGSKLMLATTQEQYPVDVAGLEKYQSTNPALATLIAEAAQNRGIIKEGTLSEYQKDDKFLHAHDHAPIFAVDRPHTYEGVKWAMAIDLNKCTGCGECVVSCIAENNIPVVGKDQVIARRIMHWMRIDRYYSGTAEDPKTSLQPMLCQHCDNAPCENVCPIVATAHSPEGLNDIAYNRCVGTRYCANNCPYKVRRFNYYNFRDHLANGHQEKPVFALLQNPEVTVRSRGVIEKCSFCVQRISASKALVKAKKQEWVGQGVVSACQEACPTNAISFGNVNDAHSDVAVAKNHNLSYRVLEELAVKPNVHYIAKLRNAEGKAHA